MENRYLRNIPALSERECLLLQNKRVAVVGCGGIGGYLIELLSRLGVGYIKAIDPDVFDESNLNRQLLLEQERGQATAFRPDWSGVPLVSVDTAQYILGGSGKDFETYSGWLAGGEALTLQPGGWEMPLIEGVSISAAGFMGDQFHLQLRFDGDGPDDHGWFDLLTPMGVVVQNPVNLAFRDEDAGGAFAVVYHRNNGDYGLIEDEQ